MLSSWLRRFRNWKGLGANAEAASQNQKIIGLTRVRNESFIIKDTLDLWGIVCTGGIYVYDDASTDSTPEICGGHPSVRAIVRGTAWDSVRERAEWMNRQAVLEEARPHASRNDWFAYFDADEHPYLDHWEWLHERAVKAVQCRLYDIYITPQDVNALYSERDFVGPEYRTITMFFRNHPALSYDKPDQRVVSLPRDKRKVITAGFIKHFGKGISVAHWEATCDYYANHFPKYSEKWRKRKGKAIKSDYLSDFGNPLISFSSVLKREVEGFPLESMPYGKN